MNKPILVVLIFVGIAVMLYAGFSSVFASGTWRYKMTVQVETPEGIMTGSAVREVSVQRGISLATGTSPEVTLKGAAVVVDLGARGKLFGLLRGYRGHAKSLPFYAFPSGVGYTTKEGLRFYSALKAEPKELELMQYPVFVAFSGSKDPRTVQNLIDLDMEACIRAKSKFPGKEPCLKEEHFEEVFGKGVKLKSVTIEMTDEPVTSGIKDLIPIYDNKGYLVTKYDLYAGEK